MQAGGNVVRLVGLYHSNRGAHTYFLKVGNALVCIRKTTLRVDLYYACVLPSEAALCAGFLGGDWALQAAV